MTKTAQLGTFSGVFTPSILTILGIILFLRLGYVVGTAGLYESLLIIFLANAISVLSSLSLAAIATNLTVKGGGDYYLISRTLGHAFGGAIGIVLFLAQAVSVAFYSLGFAEILTDMLPPHLLAIESQSVAAAAIVLLFVFAWLGADWATRFQFVVMAVLTLALLSFFWGSLQHWNSDTLSSNLAASDHQVRFWVMFALFFPAVTGFTQGVSMSGDLKDPGSSLPLGTFSAVLLSIVVYFLAALCFAGAIGRDELINLPNPMTRVAINGDVITAGVFAATLSSAMASFLGAPRILQSLAQDRLWKSLLPFARGVGPQNNPRRGVLLTGAIALLTVFLGPLNRIAPVVSMFFLISYGLINFATFFEATSGSPSFRPVFRWFNRYLSLLGALLCLGAMLAVNIIAGLVALTLLTLIYFYLDTTLLRSRWADGWRSFHLFRVREHLLAAFREPEHPRDWRPNMLLFPMNYPGRRTLYRFAAQLEAQSGFTTVVKIVVGTGAGLNKSKQEQEQALQQELQRDQLLAFPLVVTAPSIDTSIHTLIQAYGIGPLRANTILLPWPVGIDPQNPQLGHNYAHHLRVAVRLQCNLLVLAEPRTEPERPPATRDWQRIDIWWTGGASSHLSLLLAYLLQRHEDWKDSELRLLCAPYQGKAVDLAYLRQHLKDIRIPASIREVSDITPHTTAAESADTDMVFLPFRLHKEEFLTVNGAPLAELLHGMPLTALVLAKRDFELDSEPESGTAAETAEILDALDDARGLCEFYRQQLEKLRQEKEKLRQQTGTEVDEKRTEIEQQLEKTFKRKAKAEAKLRLAEQRAKNLAPGNAPSD